MTDLSEGTIRIPVSLTWDDAFDTDVARTFTEQVHADRSACLQGPVPDSEGHGPDLTDTLDAVTADGARAVLNWSDGPATMARFHCPGCVGLPDNGCAITPRACRSSPMARRCVLARC